MFRLFSYRNFFYKIAKTLMLVCFIFVVLQAQELNAQSLVEKAKNEGKLMLYTPMNLQDTHTIIDAFMKKYPFIKFEAIRLPGTKVITKLVMEKNAGIKMADVINVFGFYANIYKKEGLIQPYVSPEARDWPRGFKDPEGYWAAVYNNFHTFLYNTRMVSEKEAPKRYEHLLDPKWKGMIGMSDREEEWYKGMMDLMGREKGLQFMKRLADQEIKFFRGRTLTAQLMVSGEVAIAKAGFQQGVRMKEAGAPLQWVDFPTPSLAALRILAVHADAPHPNAAKLFIDFMLSKEGQTLIVKLGRQPVRMDVKTNPILEKVRRNSFPIKPTPAEESETYMKEYQTILLRR